MYIVEDGVVYYKDDDGVMENFTPVGPVKSTQIVGNTERTIEWNPENETFEVTSIVNLEPPIPDIKIDHVTDLDKLEIMAIVYEKQLEILEGINKIKSRMENA